MKSILCSEGSGLNLPKEVQLHRMLQVMEKELTPVQREVIQAFYFQGMTITDIARMRGVCFSTVQRTLRRAEGKLRRFLQY